MSKVEWAGSRNVYGYHDSSFSKAHTLLRLSRVMALSPRLPDPGKTERWDGEKGTSSCLLSNGINFLVACLMCCMLNDLVHIKISSCESGLGRRPRRQCSCAERVGIRN
jgi:hypothetical protein